MKEPVRVEIEGKILTCPHCDGDVFSVDSVSIDQIAAGGLFVFEGWFGLHATVYACTRCGRLEWFVGDASRRHEQSDPDHLECLSCGETIPDGEAKCPKCGWTFAPEA